MVDGILTKLRNPVNQDLWLTDRFSTSVNHPLFLSLFLAMLHVCPPDVTVRCCYMLSQVWQGIMIELPDKILLQYWDDISSSN